MSTCFLFTQHLNEEGCLSLKLNQQGQIEAPLAQRNFTEIKTFQTNAQTIVVAPGERFSLHQLELPWLTDRKARAAIPYALEDKLAQNVETLHFAFDGTYYQNGHYLVVVGDKIYLNELISLLDEHEVNFDILTLDWFALKTHETAVLTKSLLANDETFQGAVSPDLASFYLGKWAGERTIYLFPDSDKSQLPPTEDQIIESQESSYLWLAQRLQEIRPMNICQGELQHGSSHAKTIRWYQAAVFMSLLWILSIVTVNAVKIHYLNKDTAGVDANIALIYREFFPQAQQVISPKFRIGQLIKSNQNNADSTFWTLLDKLATTLKSSSITIEQLRFQNQTLMVTLATKDFESLEDLQTRLQQDKIKVKQTQASTRDEQVVSTLELNL